MKILPTKYTLFNNWSALLLCTASTYILSVLLHNAHLGPSHWHIQRFPADGHVSTTCWRITEYSCDLYCHSLSICMRSEMWHFKICHFSLQFISGKVKFYVWRKKLHLLYANSSILLVQCAWYSTRLTINPLNENWFLHVPMNNFIPITIHVSF
jgi:hypothetical protein